ncbi:type III toxin-antitoxin system ToxN/AbiQ family toxin [Psittacicella gerlachiana]|uniref:Type III toxin-antitoxin system ToxN/AbiQ family toxin n=1 Tax=Psittacicella gerlachiana TaxID=2028574 RepID=A0A3A1YD06_9GAMM|nr:type III toxin-antitoxin system ToxN/AbiQ family toxin [Psittacicella gerlachiana]RIY35040.1 hypothetical protein CKF59_04215 [Psittacicella gerlachiana]
MTKLKLYSVDSHYLQYLYQIDPEVYCVLSNRKQSYPLVGLIVEQVGREYFIPLTAARDKHKKFKNSSREHFLIYEYIEKEDVSEEMICVKTRDKYKKILAVIEIKKMIPLAQGTYAPVNFLEITDHKYLALLQKEYNFCLNIEELIIKKARAIYEQQRESKVVHRFHCNYSKLEKAMALWQERNLERNLDKECR